MELTANIHFEDRSYWADVPELPGCFATGDTLDELFASLQEGIELYLGGDGDRPSVSAKDALRVKSAILSDASVSQKRR